MVRAVLALFSSGRVVGQVRDQFQFFAPLTFFEKAGAAPGKRRRIAGVISTEALDKQNEIVVQKGLDFTPFLEHGWFNDNHSRETDAVLGYPVPGGVKRFAKGDVLPDGTRAEYNGTWAEGYLLDTPRARSIWELGRSLAKAGNDRRLGFSIEGNVLKREGPGRKIVSRALVRNVAITNCPVGYGTRLELLAKSLSQIEQGVDVEKALTATGAAAAAPGQNPSEQGPTTGEGAGRIITPQSLEEDEKDETETGMSKAEIYAAISDRFPAADAPFLERAYRVLSQLAEQGRL